MEKIEWTVTEPNGEAKVVSNRKQLSYREEIEIDKDMAKGTKIFAEQYNEMRQRLIELGEMKSK